MTDPEVESDVEIEQARQLSRTHLSGLLEALVFASDKPMKAIELARLASAPVKQVRELMDELRTTYAHRGILLEEIAGGWLFRTNVEFAPFVRELTSERPVRLTRAQVETLAIVAYRQPVTRPEVDDIRGVDSGATLRLLLERDLLRILGKKDEPGRPILYGTTNQFLEFFGLKSLKDLPTLREFTELSDESLRVAEAELGDVVPGMAIAYRVPPGGRSPARHPRARSPVDERRSRRPGVTARASSVAGGVGVLLGELRDLVPKLLVRRDLPQKLPDERIRERLHRVDALGLARDGPATLGQQLGHRIHVDLGREALCPLPGEHGRLVYPDRRRQLLCGAREHLAECLDVVPGHGISLARPSRLRRRPSSSPRAW